MERRKFFFSAAAAALALPRAAQAWEFAFPPGVSPSAADPFALSGLGGTALDVSATHAALFYLWFPVGELTIPPPLAAEIHVIAGEVRQALYAGFTASSLLAVLEGMTQPKLLPFYDALHSATDPAVQSFLATPGGFGRMPPALRAPLFSFLFRGSAGALSTQLAMLLREAYLSGIWDLPLAVPLCKIAAPRVFVDDPRKWAETHAPKQPPSRLRYDAGTGKIRHVDGPIDYVVVGSGPAGSTVAHELQRAGKRVVLIERGPFVVWGSMDTRSYPALMFRSDALTTENNSAVVRSGETLGGGTAVNIDLAFSPLLPNIQKHINAWSAAGLIEAKYYTPEAIAAAYSWVTARVPNYHVPQDELNPDNLVLWNGALAYGIQPSRYRLNRFRPGTSPSPVDDKHDAAIELLYPCLEDVDNPLSVIPDAQVERIVMAPAGHDAKAAGLLLTMQTPWTTYGNTVVDPAGLRIPVGTTVEICADNIILCAGTLGTTQILARSAQANAVIDNPRIGKGLVIHPSLPIIGHFTQPIDMLDGLDGGVYVDNYAVKDGFILESMTGLPSYGSLLIMGDGKQVFDQITEFNHYAGYGVALIDTVSDSNAISLGADGEVVVNYNLVPDDIPRFRRGVAIAVRMMFLAGATRVLVPSNENFLDLPDFDPMRGVYLTDIAQADLLERNLRFTPNRTFLTAAHLQAANKIGPSHKTAVVSTSQRLWTVDGREVCNAFVMDSSIFPTSVGANPMQAIYTFAKIFCDRLSKEHRHDSGI